MPNLRQSLTLIAPSSSWATKPRPSSCKLRPLDSTSRSSAEAERVTYVSGTIWTAPSRAAHRGLFARASEQPTKGRRGLAAAVGPTKRRAQSRPNTPCRGIGTAHPLSSQRIVNPCVGEDLPLHVLGRSGSSDPHAWITALTSRGQISQSPEGALASEAGASAPSAGA
jgi:hypothetical protein